MLPALGISGWSAENADAFKQLLLFRFSKQSFQTKGFLALGKIPHCTHERRIEFDTRRCDNRAIKKRIPVLDSLLKLCPKSFQHLQKIAVFTAAQQSAQSIGPGYLWMRYIFSQLP